MHDSKKFVFFPIASSINQIPSSEIAKEIQTELLHLGGECVDENRIHEETPFFFLILTGGTEQKLYELWQKRKSSFYREPVIILTHGGNNSLPASLEIIARLQQEGAKGTIIYIDERNKEYKNDIDRLIKHLNIFHKLHKTNIGLIGESSEWLIASMPEVGLVKNVWGPQVIKISINELKEEISTVKENEIEDAYSFFVNRAEAIKEPSRKEIKQVVKIYSALRKLKDKYELSALTLRCFDLVTDLESTGCFALAKLNDEGITAGCEGDLVSTIGMVWASAITDQSVWMANPAQIDEVNNIIKLAHCTVPIGMVDKYRIRSHFESGLGVGIEGEFSKGKITLFRLGGKDIKKLWITNGEIISYSKEENLCRTQVNVKIHGAKPSELLTEPLGNHLLMIRGSFAKEMEQWHNDFIYDSAG